jgi:hypothetical protein
MERLFWQTLNERQRLVAKLIWPLGLRWNKMRRHLYFLAACSLAVAAGLRLLSLTMLVWLALFYGSLFLFVLAPILPGYDFALQPLLLGSWRAARCLLFPVSLSEICVILHRCQTIRVAGACWIGATYGALAWLIMGLNIRDGSSAGLSIIFLSFGAHPFAMLAKLSALTQTDCRHLVSVPIVLILTIAVIFALVGSVAGVLIPAILVTDPPQSHYFILIVFAFALAWRFIGWALLKIYLLFIERSWLDAVAEIKPAKRK